MMENDDDDDDGGYEDNWFSLRDDAVKFTLLHADLDNFYFVIRYGRVGRRDRSRNKPSRIRRRGWSYI